MQQRQAQHPWVTPTPDETKQKSIQPQRVQTTSLGNTTLKKKKKKEAHAQGEP